MTANPTQANISRKWSFIKYIASKIPACSSNQDPMRSAAPKNTVKQAVSKLDPFIQLDNGHC